MSGPAIGIVFAIATGALLFVFLPESFWQKKLSDAASAFLLLGSLVFLAFQWSWVGSSHWDWSSVAVRAYFGVVLTVCLPIAVLRLGKPNLRWFHYLMAWFCILVSLLAHGLLVLGYLWKDFTPG